MNAYQNSNIGEVRLNDAYFAPRIAANHTHASGKRPQMS